MNQQNNSHRSEEVVVAAPQYTLQWPMFLVILSLMILLAWQVTLAVQQYVNLQRVAEQQTMMEQQAKQAEINLQALMMDVVELSKASPEARAVVRKYNIKYNPPAGQGTTGAQPEKKPQLSPKGATAVGH